MTGSRTNPGAQSTNGSTQSGASPTGVLRDAVELGELQLRLLREDLRETSQQAKSGIFLIIAATAMLLAVLPVSLLAMAAILELVLEFSRAAALGLAAAAGLALSLCGFALGWFVLRRSTKNLSRSREELHDNLAWVKQMLTPGR